MGLNHSRGGGGVVDSGAQAEVRIFISYKTEDRELVEPLARIARWVRPAGRGLTNRFSFPHVVRG